MTLAASVARFVAGNHGVLTAGAASTALTRSTSSTAAAQSGTLSRREEFVPTVAITGNGRHAWLVMAGRYMRTGMLRTEIKHGSK